MKPSPLILALILPLAIRPTISAQAPATPPQTNSASSSAPASQTSSAPASSKSQSIPAVDLQNARKAHNLLEQAIQALGGQTYLNVHTIKEQGRAYSFYHGRPTGNGVLFWRFVEYPDQERIEVTPERDVAYLYVGNKGWELTYKGPSPVETKDLQDYLRRRKFSLENILRVWINDPTVALFYDGNALAGNSDSDKITLIDSKDEAVDLFLDLDSHLPIKKSYKWRDPVDRQPNVEEEIYDNFRMVQGVNTPYGFTRYFNGDMQSERFVNAVHYNEQLDQAMFDPNSGYNPNKPGKKH
ncbi:MAG: hypothetical protein WA252_09750 [Candidatus Sulfotelmatobacter sp.]